MRFRAPGRRRRPRGRLRLWRGAALALLSLPLLAAAAAGSAAAKSRPQAPAEQRRHARESRTRALQRRLDRVRTRLRIDRAVSVAIVEQNPYLVSVETPREEGGAFIVQVEARLLDLLTKDEVEAALAHELGHVWVFTHHPYLQTEMLANQVAMRVVRRDALVRVYEKIWKQGGKKGDLSSFLGDD